VEKLFHWNKIKKMISSRSVQLYFNASNQSSAFINIGGNAKMMIVKQATIVNTAQSTPSTAIAMLKCDLIPFTQTLCNFPLISNTNWCINLNNKFSLSNPIISGTYNFTLVENEQTPIDGSVNLEVYVNLILEFY
jgi:hypothetical protein